MALVRVYPSAAGAAVLIPNERQRHSGESDVAFLARIATHAESADASLVNGQDVDASTLPTDRDFRKAWKLSGAQCVVDMPIAREVHRDKLRAARAPKLAELDALYLRELERGPQGKPQDIATQKQALRDLPQNPQIDAAASPAALRALWPTSLLGATPYRG